MKEEKMKEEKMKKEDEGGGRWRRRNGDELNFKYSELPSPPARPKPPMLEQSLALTGEATCDILIQRIAQMM